MIADLNTYLTKAIPDTRLTIEKYADAKFEYLVSRTARDLEQGTDKMLTYILRAQFSPTV